MDSATGTLAAIATAVIGLAIVAVLVSNKAQTPQVISSAGSAFSTIIGAAIAPVTGGTVSTAGVGNFLGNSSGNYLTPPTGSSILNTGGLY